MADIAWQPDQAVIDRAQLSRFLRLYSYSSFDEMYRASIEDVARFTEQVLGFLEIPFHRPYNEVLNLDRGKPWARWCVDGGLNIAQACLTRGAPKSPAVIAEREDGSVSELSYQELTDQVRSCAAGLRRLGVGKGDAVAIHLPMNSDVVLALLAAAYVGAVAVPLFSGYGRSAIESRVSDVGARVILTCHRFQRRGKYVQAAENCPPVEHLLTELPLADPSDVDMELTEAEDPLLILYTSGTTGRPKGILHTHCGFPVKSAQDMCFGTDVGEGTRICWITDIGWMMGPWLIYGALLLGGTLCLYDGAPDHPGPDRIWDFCDRHMVEVLGISPTLIRALSASGDEPVRRHDLRSLRIFGSTGEAWNPAPWWWLFEAVGKRRVPIINYSGGTEISGGILMGNPLLPLKPCSFSAPCPGIAADVVDENGNPVTGSVGELVIREPWIGMARGFYGDPQRYLDTYWNRWPDTWVHGDFCLRDEDGFWFILGRSDDTLKIAGKRVGPAEIESVLVRHADVVEAAAIGVPHELKGECLHVFCVLRSPAAAPSETLASELRDLVAAEMGKPLRPDAIHFVPALPKTRNAKVMRRVIRAAYLNQDAGDLTALENPQAVEAIRSTREEGT